MKEYKGILSGSTLKLIALAAMAVDHAACLLVNPHTSPELYQILRGLIGRASFPLFCFLLVEGFCHTGHLSKYILRLGLFAIISEIPFDLAFFGTFFYPEYQNIFFSLFIGILMLALFQYIMDHLKDRPVQLLLLPGTVLAGCFLAYALHTDYGYMGILLIFAFYVFRGKKVEILLSNCLFNMIKNQPFGIISAPLIYLYNGKRGISLKYLFYAFYPIHLIILYLIAIALRRG